MTKFNFNETVPFEPTHVGEVIKDELAARGMRQSELASLTGIQKPILNDVIKGKRSLTPEMALLVETALGIPAALLLNVQTQYELDKAKLSQRVIEQNKSMEIWKVLKEHISVPFFRSVGVVKGKAADDVRRVFGVFHVSSLDSFFELEAMEQGCSYYRKSDKVATKTEDIFSWKYYCYYLAKGDNTTFPPFDKSANVVLLTKELNAAFRDNHNVIRKTAEILRKRGIRLVIVKKVGQVPVDGMSFWEGATPTIVITERIATIDNFAFTVFHEVGHVFKHLEQGGKAMINIEETRRNTEEAEADSFASDAIMPKEEWRKFMAATHKVLPYKIAPYIKDVADRRGLNPQILFGRYKHDIGFYKIRNHFETKIM